MHHMSSSSFKAQISVSSLQSSFHKRVLFTFWGFALEKMDGNGKNSAGGAAWRDGGIWDLNQPEPELGTLRDNSHNFLYGNRHKFTFFVLNF